MSLLYRLGRNYQVQIDNFVISIFVNSFIDNDFMTILLLIKYAQWLPDSILNALCKNVILASYLILSNSNDSKFKTI